MRTAKTKTKKASDRDSISLGKMAIWETRDISKNMNLMVVGYLTLYCTNILGLNALLVGTLLLVSRLIDGFTDVVAGYIVDRTNTKIGRGRPYEICIVGLWAATVFMFSCPQGWSTAAKCIWVLVMYALVNSIFATFLNASGTPYMVRAFNSQKIYVSLTSYGGLMTIIAVAIVNTTFPILMGQLATSAKGWTTMVLIYAIPAALIGMLRFFFIPEKYNVDATTEKINFKDVLQVLKTNRYIYIIAAMQFVVNLVSAMNVGSYYAIYIIGNISMQSVFSVISFACMPLMLAFPSLLKRFTKTQLITAGFVLMSIGSVIAWFAKASVPLMALNTLVSGLGSLPVNMLSGLMIIDCADYNEWKGQPRMEATLSVIPGLANKIASAFGAFLLGVFLTAGGFVSSTADGSYAAQPDSAILMIRLLVSWIPLIFYVAALIVLHFYRLDKLMPQIQADNARKRAQKQETAEDIRAEAIHADEEAQGLGDKPLA